MAKKQLKVHPELVGTMSNKEFNDNARRQCNTTRYVPSYATVMSMPTTTPAQQVDTVGGMQQATGPGPFGSGGQQVLAQVGGAATHNPLLAPLNVVPLAPRPSIITERPTVVHVH